MPAVMAACSILLATAPRTWADSPADTEYVIKAVFLYNFLQFVDWPADKIGDSNEPLIMGVLGKNEFLDAFTAIERRTVNNRPIVVRHFKGIGELEKAGQKEPSEPPKSHPQIELIRTSHLLFLFPSEKQHTKEILRSVEGHHILTVADTKGFLEDGGVINLLLDNERVSFEVNMTAARQAGLQIRSRLLRLARRIYTPPEE